ncbi:MAG: hypothetical protein R3321_03520 [Nitrososphaeraceae archaeon]|nr:hypothetical protein [Nitrososphaeraceae archaeon]
MYESLIIIAFCLVLILTDKFRCKHKWTIKAKIISYPNKKIELLECTESHVEKMSLGYTNILMTCDKCGKVIFKRVPGIPEVSHHD